jgi:hypothetical protein
MDKEKVIKAIEDLQAGRLNKTDAIRFDPEITGRGVSIMRLATIFIDDDPAEVAQALKHLIAEGRIIEVIDPDDWVSFSMPKK